RVGTPALKRGNHIEAIAVAKPHVDNSISGRRFLHLQQSLGYRLRRRYGKASLLKRFGKPLQERKIVLDDQQRSFAGDSFLYRPVGGLGGGIHVVTSRPTRILPCRAQPSHTRISDYGCSAQAAANVKDCSKSLRLQSNLMMAPRSGWARFSKVTVAPERSSRVLAMKKPNPRPVASSPVSLW